MRTTSISGGTETTLRAVPEQQSVPRQQSSATGGRLRRFLALARWEQLTLLVAAASMPLFWLGLRAQGLPRFRAQLSRPVLAARSPEQIAAAQALGRLVNIAARHTLGPRTCLTRSLLLVWMLQRRGIGSDLRIGVSLNDGVLAAHAWVECDGIPVNDQPDVAARFASFGDLVPLDAFRAK